MKNRKWRVVFTGRMIVEEEVDDIHSASDAEHYVSTLMQERGYFVAVEKDSTKELPVEE